jgi:RHS repeat-associated protein
MGYEGQIIPIMVVTLSSSDQYFGSRRLAPMDQLGSVVNSSQSYFPWGETKGTSNPQDTWNFATYWQDSWTGLDYANNRYYSNAYGRFMTLDPYQATATSPSDPKTPQSWNRYAYVQGDPINYNDANGQELDLLDSSGFFGGGGGGWWGGCGYVMTFVDGMQMPSPCDFVPILPVFAPQPKPTPRIITIQEIDDCIFPNGTGITGGAWVLEVEYQVLVNGQPILGNYSLANAGISQVSETVTTTSGGPINGNGAWCLSNGNCAAPGSLTPSGTFWDVLSGNGTANQSFAINGQTTSVTFPGAAALTKLKDVFNSPGHSISVGGGALTGNSATRQCGTKNGDPSTN